MEAQLRYATATPRSTGKGPDPIDKHVGRRVREARLAAGISQEKLGDALGVTFQQVQKYEKGVNRVAPSRLQTIARTLSREVAWFFDGAPGKTNGTALRRDDALDALACMRDGHRLARAFVAIASVKLRASILDLAEACVGEQGDGHARDR